MENIDWVDLIVKAFLAIVTSCFAIEITPIKINPISWFCKRIADNINKERDEKINKIESTLNTHIDENNKQTALNERANIIRFAEDLKMKKIPSEEHFDIILDDITAYKKYCADNPDFPNSKCLMSIDLINGCYKKYYHHA